MKTDLLDLIRQERRRRGWSMRAAANAAGVSNTTWSRVEAGAVEMTPHMVAAIAKAFDWPADWETNPPTVEHPSTTVDIDDRLNELAAEVREQRALIEVLLHELKGGDDRHGEKDSDGRPAPEPSGVDPSDGGTPTA